MTALISLTPIELLLRVSAASVGAGEVGGPNAGPYVERVQRRTGNTRGAAWCCSQGIDWLVLALAAQCPAIPKSGRVQDIVDWAGRVGCRYIPGNTEKGRPRVGDLYAINDPAKEGHFHHIGLIIALGAKWNQVDVRDGNTTDPKLHNVNTQNDREGWLVVDKPRVITPKYRLLRWVELMP